MDGYCYLHSTLISFHFSGIFCHFFSAEVTIIVHENSQLQHGNKSIFVVSIVENNQSEVRALFTVKLIRVGSVSLWCTLRASRLVSRGRLFSTAG